MSEYANSCANSPENTEKIPDGILPIYKEAGLTSHDVVNKIRKLYGTKQVGHTGTLDPMAEGVLIMLVGRAVKASEYVTNNRKCYIATLKLGIVTDTGDVTGKITDSYDGKFPTPEEVLNAAERLKGEISQLPPMYSAKKVNGKKLYESARNGEIVERKSQIITIYNIDVAEKNLNENEYTMKVECSGGTYIRTICTDMGEILGCGGTMASLIRTQAGMFKLTDCHKLCDIEMLTSQQRNDLLLPTEKIFEELPIVQLNEFYSKLAHDGLEIYQKKIRSEFHIGQRVRLYDDGFFALGEVKDYADGSAIKPIKQFKLIVKNNENTGE